MRLRLRVRAPAADCIVWALWSMLLLAALSDCNHFSQPDVIQWSNSTEDFHIQTLDSMSFSCPDAMPILAIYSQFNATVVDRLWDFHCARPISFFSEFQPKPWGDNHSQLKMEFSQVCPMGSVISGVASAYHVSHLDRVWQFLCSGVPVGYTYGECSWTQYTRSRQDVSLSLLEGDRRLGVIAGVETKYEQPSLDRRWRYLLCSLQKVECDTPHLDNGTVLVGATTTYQSSIRFSCQPGYFLAGPQIATCTSNGTWTQLPTCAECKPIRYCVEVVCGGPEGTLCQRCQPTNPSGLRLVLSKNRKKCRVPPVILSLSLLLPFVPGDTLLLPCEAIGNPSPRITWYKGGQLLALTERVHQLQNGYLSIANASDSDTGEYECLATSNVGEDSLNFTLYNTMPPPSVPVKIINWLQISPHCAGDFVWLHCQTTGYPPPTITWTGFSDPIPYQQPNSRVTQFANGTLAFLPAEADDTGVYTCRATNSVGSDQQQVVLFVQDTSEHVAPGEFGYLGEVEPARIILWRDSYTVELGQSLELECQVTGIPPPTVIWVKDGMVVEGDPGEEQQDFREEGGVAHSNSSLLFFRNASAEDAGEYKCIAWNRGGVTMQVTAVVVGVVVVTSATPTTPPTTFSPSVHLESAASPTHQESAASPAHHNPLWLFIPLCLLLVCCV